MYARPGYFSQSPLPQFAVSPKGTAQEAGSVAVLRAGTPVFLRLAETLTSRRKPGDIVQMKVYQDVKVGDTVVLAKGSHAWGTIDSGTHGPGFGGIGGDIAIEVNGVQAITGHSVKLRALSAQHNGDFIPEDPLSLALMSAVKGLHAQVPKGTFVLAYVESDSPFSAELVRTINQSCEGLNVLRIHRLKRVHFFFAFVQRSDLEVTFGPQYTLCGQSKANLLTLPQLQFQFVPVSLERMFSRRDFEGQEMVFCDAGHHRVVQKDSRFRAEHWRFYAPEVKRRTKADLVVLAINVHNGF